VLFIPFAVEALAMLVVGSYCGFTGFSALRHRRFWLGTVGAFCAINALLIFSLLAWAAAFAGSTR
jgi:hypothetical protein